jgi:hypothetical protein
VLVAETANASKERRGRDQALALSKIVDRIVAAKGKKIVEFDMKGNPPDESTLLAHLLGPTGNLRAPTARMGRTLIVGFNPEVYEKQLL